MKGSGEVRKRPNLAGIAWLVFVGLAAAAAQCVPLVQTLWLSEAVATTRQALHQMEERSDSPDPASQAADHAKPGSTAG